MYTFYQVDSSCTIQEKLLLWGENQRNMFHFVFFFSWRVREVLQLNYHFLLFCFLLHIRVRFLTFPKVSRILGTNIYQTLFLSSFCEHYIYL